MSKSTFGTVFLDIPDYMHPKNFGGSAPVDKLIAKSIRILNSKGYPTMYCCSGHKGCSKKYLRKYAKSDKQKKEWLNQSRKIVHPYICFLYPFIGPLPKGWYRIWDKEPRNNAYLTCIYFQVKNPNYRKLRRIFKEFEMWCRKLPEAKPPARIRLTDGTEVYYILKTDSKVLVELLEYDEKRNHLDRIFGTVKEDDIISVQGNSSENLILENYCFSVTEMGAVGF